MSARPAAADRGAPLRRLRRRLLVLVVVLLLMIGTLVGRLTQVQLIDPAAALTDTAGQPVAQPGLTTVVVPAIRGQIFDRNGVPLVLNASHPALVLDRAVLAGLDDDGEALFATLSVVLDVPAEELRQRTTSCGAPGGAPVPLCTPGSPAAPAVLVGRLDDATALAVAERPELYPGVSVEPVPTRAYPHPEGVLAPHALGYLAPATRADIEARKGAVSDGELVGRAGLEAQYDDVLRGTPGRQVLRTDPRGVPLELVEEVAPVPGKDLRTTLDARLQAVAEKALEAQVIERRRTGSVADSAAAVVLDITDGGVLALASYPTYDPAVWVGGISAGDYAALTAEASHQPLISRVTEAGLAPASTFKPISAVATLAAGGSLTGAYDCPASYRIGGRDFTNFQGRDYGQVPLSKALEVSCSTMFYEAAYQSWLDLGGTRATDDDADPFIATARAFGLGTRTGIDLPGEAAGRIPGREWRREQWEATKEQTCRRAETGYPEIEDRDRRELLESIAEENCEYGYLYRGGDAANLSIGQGDVLATPLQMAQAYEAIATGGTTMTPRLADALIDPLTQETTQLPPTPGPSVPLDPAVGAYLRDALTSVVTDGTAAFGFEGFDLDAWPVGGKTGSAERGAGNDVSWFVSFAPATSPRYIVAVAVTQAGLGSEAAVPVARTLHDRLRSLDAIR